MFGGVGNEVRECNTQICPVYGPWGAWEECSTTCGKGFRYQERECLKSSNELCYNITGEQHSRYESCFERPCPKWTEWEGWSDCSGTCRNGDKGAKPFRFRNRGCELEDLAECFKLDP